MALEDLTILVYAQTLGHPVVLTATVPPGVVEVDPMAGVVRVHPDAGTFTVRMNAGTSIPSSTVKSGGRP